MPAAVGSTSCSGRLVMRTALQLLVLTLALSAQAAPSKPKSASAAKGPLRLTLEVANPVLRGKDSLWVRVRLTNIGKSTRTVRDDAFGDILGLTDAQGPLSLEVRDAKTKEPWTRGTPDDHSSMEGEFQECLARYEEEHPQAPPRGEWVLAPGKSISTPSQPAYADFKWRHCRGEAPPESRPPYGELADWHWVEDAYEVRAVFDDTISERMLKKLPPEARKKYADGVRIETGWVPVRRKP